MIDKRGGGAVATIGTSAHGLVEKQADGTTVNTNAVANRDKIKKLIKNKKFGGFVMFNGTEVVGTTISDESKTLFGHEAAQATTALKPTAKELIDFRRDE